MVELGRSAGGSLGGGLTYASLFSGCGGADIGLCAAGLKPLWFCEIAEKPSDVLRYRYPDVPNYGDIEKLDPETLEVPGVLWMSPPCQDISIAGAQVGLEGERSGLFYEAIRICRTLVRRGTSIVLMEQVPNLRSIKLGRDMASVLGEFLDIGARDIGWTLLDTQFAGIPQSRDRIFFVVDFGGERASEILSFASRLCRDASPRRKAGESATGTLAAGTRSGGRACSADEANQLVPMVAGTITAEFADQTGQDCHNLLPVIYDGRGRGGGETSSTLCTDHAGRPSDQCPVIVTHDPAATILAQMHKGIDHADGPINAVIALHPRAIGRENGGPEGKDWRDDTGYTLDAGEPMGVCYLPNSERLQGYNGSHAYAEEANTREVLQLLQRKIGAETIKEQEGARVTAALLEKEILQSAMHGAGVRREASDEFSILDDSTLPCEETGSSGAMRKMSKARCDRCAPQGRGLDKQQFEQSGETLQGMPQQRASHEASVPDMRQACKGLWILRQALPKVQEVGRSSNGEAQPALPTYAVRRLTPLEAERLQGFPDDWTRWGINRKGEKYELADTPRYRMIGNAVSSCWGQQLGERVLEAAS